MPDGFMADEFAGLRMDCKITDNKIKSSSIDYCKEVKGK